MPGVSYVGTGFEVEDNAGVEVNALERPRDGLFASRKAIAVSPDGACEYEGNARRAILELVHGLGVGRLGIRMINALHDRPRRSWRPPGNRLCARLSAVERLDRERVISLNE